jgi:uncharacterized membrane protein
MLTLSTKCRLLRYLGFFILIAWGVPALICMLRGAKLFMLEWNVSDQTLRFGLTASLILSLIIPFYAVAMTVWVREKADASATKPPIEESTRESLDP